MPKKRFFAGLWKAIAAGLLSGCFLSAAQAASEVAGTLSVIRFGISTFAEYSENSPIIPATTHLMQSLFGADNVRVTVLPIEKLSEGAKNGEYDILLTSAGAFRRLALEGAGVRDLASVASERVPNPNYADGSVIFVRADSPRESLEDLQGKSVAANHSKGFSGWLVALGEIYRQGFNPENFFSRVDFTDHDMDEVIRRVDAGESDAGVVRACFFEDIGADLSRYRILSRKWGYETACATSTQMYPNWTVSTLPTLDPEDARRIAAALFAMEPLGRGVHWSIANDYRGIDALFRSLKIGPFAYLQHFSLSRFLAENWPFFAIAATMLLALLLHSLTVGALVRKRTGELEASVAREKRLLAESAAAQRRFLSLQKAGVVGQMSSMIAHELRQPLAAISMNTYGLMNRFRAGTVSPEKTLEVLTKVRALTERVSRIVDQVRSYARGDRKRTWLQLNPVFEQALREAEKSLRESGVTITPQVTAEPLFVTGNALELELVVVNLVKNAVEAVREATQEGGQVLVFLKAADGSALIEVTNHVPRLSDEAFQSIRNDALGSRKITGLGLGLSIVRSVVEDMGGRLTFIHEDSGGLTVRVTLSTQPEKGKGMEI